MSAALEQLKSVCKQVEDLMQDKETAEALAESVLDEIEVAFSHLDDAVSTQSKREAAREF